MSVQQKRTLGNIIAISFIFMIVIIIAFLSTISYNPPQIPLRTSTADTFLWGEVFNVNSINSYRYEIVNIKGGEIQKNEFFYDLHLVDGNYEVNIFPYEGISKREVDARIVFDNMMYNCINKQYRDKIESCEFIFPESDIRIGTFGTPNERRKNMKYEVLEITSSIYKERVYQSIKLESEDKKTKLWIVKDIPLPVRIEYENEGAITIANLKNYN